MRTHARLPLPRPAHAPPWAILTAAALVAGYLAGRARNRPHGGDGGEARLIEREHAALRRVTTLAARGVTAEKIFDAVAGEMGRIAAADHVVMCRYRPDGSLLVAAPRRAGTRAGERAGECAVAVGSTWTPAEGGVADRARRTGRPARGRHTAGQPAAIGVRPEADVLACPIVVEGHPWGVLLSFSAADRPRPARGAGFLELVATTMANAESRAEIAASRSRVVMAADANRRRVERDLHDGAQQRIVGLTLRAREIDAGVSPDQERLKKQVAELTEELTGVLDDVREISRGLRPAILYHGLARAVSILARRSAVPVELELDVEGRLPEGVEVAAYHLVMEALTNAAKHAGAAAVRVEVRVEGAGDDRTLHVAIHDDGTGGADTGHGTGLSGLRDRVEALGGWFGMSSPEGRGTSLTARFPIGRSSLPPRDG